MAFEMSLWKFHKNSLSERLLERKAVSLWDELKGHKTVSQKASFQFSTEDISFSPQPSMGFQISLCKYQKNSLSKGLLRESCNSVRWIHRTQRSFSESFFLTFGGRYFLCPQSPLCASKYHFANSTRTLLSKVFGRGKLYLCEIC